VTDGVAQDRAGDEPGVDDVVRALDAQLELLHSHPRRTSGAAGRPLSADAGGWASGQVRADPRACAATSRANTMIRFAAL
jgi:hypothetical protein